MNLHTAAGSLAIRLAAKYDPQARYGTKGPGVVYVDTRTTAAKGVEMPLAIASEYLTDAWARCASRAGSCS